MFIMWTSGLISGLAFVSALEKKWNRTIIYIGLAAFQAAIALRL